MASFWTSLGLTAAGTNQGTATALNSYSGYYQVSNCNAGQGVLLPTPAGSRSVGTMIKVRNDGSTSMYIYPHVNGFINNLAVNIPILLGVRGSCEFTCDGSNNWYSFVADTGSKTIPVSATRSMSLGESGSLSVIDQTAASVLTLPNVTGCQGVTYDFVIGTSAANTCTITSNAANVSGNLLCTSVTAAQAVEAVNVTNVIFAANSGNGSAVSYKSDGTNWYVKGQSKLINGFTTS